MAFFWTAAFLVLLWSFGDLRRIGRELAKKKMPGMQEQVESEIKLGLGSPVAHGAHVAQAPRRPHAPRSGGLSGPRPEVSPQMGARLFAHVFRNAPMLIDRLYADGAWAQLCHLGRLIEQAACLVNAPILAALAREMQKSLNDPQGEMAASATDRLCSELKNMLSAERDEMRGAQE